MKILATCQKPIFAFGRIASFAKLTAGTASSLKRLTGQRESSMKDAGNVIAVLSVILLERIVDRDIKQLRRLLTT
jgi:hypothetical protein